MTKKPTGGDSLARRKFYAKVRHRKWWLSFTDNILTQNARMQALVETLLRQARLENRQEVVLTVVDVAALFRRVSEARTVQLAEKKHHSTCYAH